MSPSSPAADYFTFDDAEFEVCIGHEGKKYTRLMKPIDLEQRQEI